LGTPSRRASATRLATALPNALQIGHYLTSVSKEGSGCVVDQLKLMLDANDEIRWEASGPMIERLAAAQAEPGSSTFVGTVAPSGLCGHAARRRGGLRVPEAGQ
jgi:hypothetical protein